MAKYKIAIVVEIFPKISETFILTHVAALLDLGHEVTVFSTGYDESQDLHAIFKDYKMKSLTIYRESPHIGLKRLFKIPYLLIKNIKYFKTLIKSFSSKFYGSYGTKGYFFFDVLNYTKKNNFDIIHSHFGPNASKVAYVRSLGLLKGRHITTFHGHDLNDFRVIKGHNSYKHLFPDLSGAICVVNHIKFKLEEICRQNYAIYKNPVSINTNKFIPKTDRYVEGDENSDLVFITVGRLIDWKGQFETVKAFHKILMNYPESKFKYKIIGDGLDKEKIEKYLSKHFLLQKHISLIGSCSHDDVVRELQTSHVHILYGIPDEYGNIDAQGTVVQEAQACGLPVIVSDGGGLPEGLIDGESGMVVKHTDINTLIKAIIHFINLPKAKIEEMGRCGRRFVLDNYSDEVVYSKLNKIYDRLIYQEF